MVPPLLLWLPWGFHVPGGSDQWLSQGWWREGQSKTPSSLAYPKGQIGPLWDKTGRKTHPSVFFYFISSQVFSDPSVPTWFAGGAAAWAQITLPCDSHFWWAWDPAWRSPSTQINWSHPDLSPSMEKKDFPLPQTSPPLAQRLRYGLFRFSCFSQACCRDATDTWVLRQWELHKYHWWINDNVTLAVSFLMNIKRQVSYEHFYTLELVANFAPSALLIRQYFILLKMLIIASLIGTVSFHYL